MAADSLPNPEHVERAFGLLLSEGRVASAACDRCPKEVLAEQLRRIGAGEVPAGEGFPLLLRVLAGGAP